MTQVIFKVISFKDDILWHWACYCLEIKKIIRTELYLLHNDFLPEVRRFGYKIGTQFSKIPLVIDKNNYVIKIVDVYCV